MPAVLLTIAAVAGVVGTAVSVTANKEAAEESAKLTAANNFEQRQTSARKRIRERRIIEGRLRNQASQQGVSGSSGEAGALGSIASQFASSSSADVFAQSQNQEAGNIRARLANRQGVGSLISAAGQLAGAIGGAQSDTPKADPNLN